MTTSVAADQELSEAITIHAVNGLPEVVEGDDVGSLLAEALAGQKLFPQEDDVVVITHKIVSKAEGRLVSLDSVVPRQEAVEFSSKWGKDARQVELVLQQAVRILRMERGVIIAETPHGLVCANAGVDVSNVDEGYVCLLPVDPDASAQLIRHELERRFGVQVGVVISDSFGRPWRNGIVNVAIGVAGMSPLADYRGQFDPAGHELHVSELAVADELAGAAELVMNKLDRVPAALIRGYHHPMPRADGNARQLVRDSSIDMFR